MMLKTFVIVSIISSFLFASGLPTTSPAYVEPERYKYATIKASTGASYQYIHVAPNEQANRPYILFLHGFPSLASEWRRQIDFFTQSGYGIIAPDLLGYGGTDRPTNVEAYNMKKMTREIIDILDHQEVHTAHVVGHDFGCPLLSRLAVYFPDRFYSFSFLDVGYQLPGQVFNLTAVNIASEQLLGYTTFGYWEFLGAPDAGQVINEHVRGLSQL